VEQEMDEKRDCDCNTEDFMVVQASEMGFHFDNKGQRDDDVEQEIEFVPVDFSEEYHKIVSFL